MRSIVGRTMTKSRKASDVAIEELTQPFPQPTMSVLKKTSFARLVRGLAAVQSEFHVGPDVVVGTLLAKWCDASFPGLPKSLLPRSAWLSKAPAMMSFVQLLTDEEFIESSYWLSSAYAALVGEGYRKRLAMYFTPASISKRLLDDLAKSGVDYGRQSFFDPACGGAAFLAPIAQRVRDALRLQGSTAREVLDHVECHVFGTDKDEALCALSRHFLLMALHPEIIEAQHVPELRVAQADSLLGLTGLFGTFDVIVCNPPFRKMTTAEVAPCRGYFDEAIEGQPNLYSLFIALSVKLLKQGGTCALVTPTSYLSGQNFSKLRSFVLKETRVLSLGMVSDRLGVFIDVEQETALTLLRREVQSSHDCAITSVSVVSRDGAFVDVGTCALPNSGSSWPIPRNESDNTLLVAASQSRFRLSDYGYAVRIGCFVWNRDTRPTYISAAMATRCKHGAAVPLLWSSDIEAGGQFHFNGLKKRNDEPCFVSFASRTHSAVIRRPSVLLQRVTSNDQPRRLVAAAVPTEIFTKYGGFIGENHTVILEQLNDAPVLCPSDMAELLGSPVVERYFRCISGATNVSSFELSQLRFPDPVRLKELIARGESIHDAARMAVLGK